ncbi:hypothetical protein B0J14DRAFT_364341 [Halenospora varia]|nr:hypothetical protein B0J14DRAFT_364341 [Halenospora varia]
MLAKVARLYSGKEKPRVEEEEAGGGPCQRICCAFLLFFWAANLVWSDLTTRVFGRLGVKNNGKAGISLNSPRPPRRLPSICASTLQQSQQQPHPHRMRIACDQDSDGKTTNVSVFARTMQGTEAEPICCRGSCFPTTKQIPLGGAMWQLAGELELGQLSRNI